MRKPALYAIAAVCAVAACNKATDKKTDQFSMESVEVSFKSEDGKTVYADFYEAGGQKFAPIVLLFHQARSNAGEYDVIAPRIAKTTGINCLAVDLRSGGDMWGRKNRTAAQFDSDPGYLAAYQDMEAALKWTKTEKYKKVFVWGSSYSASLAHKLAAEHPDIKALLAFSPGEYFDDKTAVRNWTANVKVPTLTACTVDEAKGDAGKIYAAAIQIPVRAANDVLIVFEDGVHGSATLLEDRNPKSSERYWESVLGFLEAYAAK